MRISRATPALALGALVLALACGGGGDSSTEQPTKGSIAGRVIDTDSANGGVSGATVQISLAGAAGQSATTSSNGQFAISNLDPGSYTVTLTTPGDRLLFTGETGTRTATVVASKTATTVTDFHLARTKGSLFGSVKNGTSAVFGINLTLTRPGFATRQVNSDASGNFTLGSVPTGVWTLSLLVPTTLQLTGGDPGTRSVNILADQNVTVTPFAVQTRAEPITATVHLSGSSFVQQNLTISAGTTVNWVNDDAASHTITPQNPDQPGVFQRASFSNSGTVLTHTFSTPGQVYHYRCELHSSDFTSGMVGTITVQ